MLTRESSPLSDELKHNAWPETRFWIGTLGVFVTVLLLSLVATTLLLATTLGYHPIVVISGSMEPGISLGDVVLYEPHDTTDIDEGTIIVFDDPTQPGGSIIHRVIDVDTDQGRLQTKGDANTTPDSTWVTDQTITGVGRILIPYVGLPAAWIQTGHTPYAIALITLLILAAYSARWGWNPQYDPWTTPPPANQHP